MPRDFPTCDTARAARIVQVSQALITGSLDMIQESRRLLEETKAACVATWPQRDGADGGKPEDRQGLECRQRPQDGPQGPIAVARQHGPPA